MIQYLFSTSLSVEKITSLPIGSSIIVIETTPEGEETLSIMFRGKVSINSSKHTSFRLGTIKRQKVTIIVLSLEYPGKNRFFQMFINAWDPLGEKTLDYLSSHEATEFWFVNSYSDIFSYSLIFDESIRRAISDIRFITRISSPWSSEEFNSACNLLLSECPTPNLILDHIKSMENS